MTRSPDQKPSRVLAGLALAGALHLASTGTPVLAESPARGPERERMVSLLLERAAGNARAARLDSAASYLKTVLRIDPGDPRGHRALLRVYELGGNLWEGLGFFESLALRLPHLPEPRTALGEIELQGNRPARALRHFERALFIRQRGEAALAGFGRSKALLGQTAEAIAFFDKLLEEAPSEGAYHYGKAATLAETENGNAAASKHFRWAISLTPESWRAHRDYGRLLGHEGDHVKAHQHLSRAIEILHEAGDAITADSIREELEALDAGDNPSVEQGDPTVRP